jgi:hypothetical protein
MHVLSIALLLAGLVCAAGGGLTAEMLIGSKLGTTEYNQEMNAIKLGKKDYHRAAQLTLPKKELLCVVFTSPNATTNEVMFRNVEMMGDGCDWAVIHYNGTPEGIDSLCNDPRLKTRAIHCARNEASKEERFCDSLDGKSRVKLSVPKTIFYHDLVPYLHKYKRVFLMDEDISLEGFDVKRFLLHWDCGLHPPPLVAQPTIFESNQYINYLNMNSWKKGDRSKVIASGVGLVEQQVPMFDAVYFEWFVRRVLSQTKETALQHGVDWGHDRSWCNAARMYSKYVLNYPNTSVPCAVLPRATPVHHLNLRSMDNKREHRDLFQANGAKVVQKYVDLFPTWVQVDVLKPNNPLDPKNFEAFPRVRKLNEKCVALVRGTQNSSDSAVLASPQHVKTPHHPIHHQTHHQAHHPQRDVAALKGGDKTK